MDYYNNYMLDVYYWELTDFEKFILDCAIRIVDEREGIRKCADNCSISKSALHRYIHKCVPKISLELYGCVKKQFKINRDKYFR